MQPRALDRHPFPITLSELPVTSARSAGATAATTGLTRDERHPCQTGEMPRAGRWAAGLGETWVGLFEFLNSRRTEAGQLLNLGERDFLPCLQSGEKDGSRGVIPKP